MATQLRIKFEEAAGWIVTGAEAGPAGTVSLPLDGFRVTVDAVDVRRLVEVTVFAEDPSAPLPASALGACRRLIGPEAADALARRPAGQETIAVPEPSGPLWEQVARAARAWFLWTHDNSATRLAALRLAAACIPLAELGAADLIPDRAWEALPAAIALGRSAARRSAVVDQLPATHRAELLGALDALTEVLTVDQWDGTGAGQIDDLRSLLGRVSDADLAALLRDPEGEEERIADSAGVRIPAFESEQEQEREAAVAWGATALDLRSRLGNFADEAFAGATARGRVPGYLNVEMTLRAGLTAAEAPPLLARVYTWSGELLGQAALRVSALPGELPRASNRVQVRLPERPGHRDRLLDDGVHVDIAIAGLPPLDATGLSREARSRARRAGIGALLSRHRADQQRHEVQAWNECARLYRLGGDPDRAAVAQDQAAAVTRRALLGQPAPWPDGPDWASALLLSWRRSARAELQDTQHTELPADRASVLQQVVRDLSAGASGAVELAQACESLARTLLESAATGSTSVPAAGAAAQAEAGQAAAAMLREALRVRYLLGDQPAAQDIAARLASVIRDDVPGPADENDD